MKPGSSPAGRELLVTKADTICAVSSASFVSVSLSAAILSDMFSSNRSIHRSRHSMSARTCNHRRTLRQRLDRDIGLQIKRSEEHTSELQSLMRISYAVVCLKKKNNTN